MEIKIISVKKMDELVHEMQDLINEDKDLDINEVKYLSIDNDGSWQALHVKDNDYYLEFFNDRLDAELWLCGWAFDEIDKVRATIKELGFFRKEAVAELLNQVLDSVDI